ncbi:hypothetical protein [Bacillus sp. FJAT-29814]|uniref:hypothetical protein n=1 Tax=Bacillus sp. FJAT-29814 TaxID=1729688 RepID=UPI00082FFAF5|nr:hypothetical protein [Bacillus sp. FJAT-29814]
MMGENIETVLTKLEILPISNPNWKMFSITLNSSSPEQEYKDAKGKIIDTVGKGVGGIYMITRENTMLYIGESKRNIHNRLVRHINKIYIRKDHRSDFFKQQHHQGQLTIYYYPLPERLLENRKVIEEMLTLVLEPEYKKWELQNKMKGLLKFVQG